MRSFDPRAVGASSAARGRPTTSAGGCRSWSASVGLVRSAFRMSWPRTLVGAWLVLRANMKWAPYPDNDPDKRPRADAALLLAAARASAASTRSARPSSRWSGGGCTASTSATRRARATRSSAPLQDLYAYSYSVSPEDVRLRPRSGQRRWTSQTAGWTRAATRRIRLLAEERALLVRSYAGAAGGRASLIRSVSTLAT